MSHQMRAPVSKNDGLVVECVTGSAIDGRPEVVKDVLPDRFTEMDLEAMLRMMKECEEQQWTSLDWGIASEVALFGMRSLTACPPRTNSWLLYRGGLENAAFLRSNRDKQRSAYATPRVSSPARYPRGIAFERWSGLCSLRKAGLSLHTVCALVEMGCRCG